MINTDIESEITWDSLSDEEREFLLMYRELSEEDKILVDKKIEEYAKLYGIDFLNFLDYPILNNSNIV